ncbi:hypothetical protein H0P51_23315 [Mycobacterium vicinigordonae]|uniref:WXG100 family type VII secretion target n=1 Tax=Mycobacterium vicinigordonae TaxID=1719132 RepID=A0A7D6EE62_9MYCO|nr:hypothetical protein H0P51_23315 [Mycobacterium vicinigordonae]
MRAVPHALAQVGAALADHGQALLDLQQACHRDAEGAQRGWVGSSARALSGFLDGWLAASTDHCGRFDQHCAGMLCTAAVFEEMEQGNAALLAGRSAR